jgi:hypothetical protein
MKRSKGHKKYKANISLNKDDTPNKNSKKGSERDRNEYENAANKKKEIKMTDYERKKQIYDKYQASRNKGHKIQTKSVQKEQIRSVMSKSGEKSSVGNKDQNIARNKELLAQKPIMKELTPKNLTKSMGDMSGFKVQNSKPIKGLAHQEVLMDQAREERMRSKAVIDKNEIIQTAKKIESPNIESSIVENRMMVMASEFNFDDLPDIPKIPVVSEPKIIKTTPEKDNEASKSKSKVKESSDYK